VIIPDGRVIITQKNYSGDEDVVVLLFHEILELAKKVKVVMNARMHNET